MKYAVVWRLKHRKEILRNEGLISIAAARAFAASVRDRSALITILQACEAEDVTPTAYHKDNIGKYFLHEIVK